MRVRDVDKPMAPVCLQAFGIGRLQGKIIGRLPLVYPLIERVASITARKGDEDKTCFVMSGQVELSVLACLYDIQSIRYGDAGKQPFTPVISVIPIFVYKDAAGISGRNHS